MFAVALYFVALGGLIWVFYLGVLYGRATAEPPPCERRHRDEL